MLDFVELILGTRFIGFVDPIRLLLIWLGPIRLVMVIDRGGRFHWPMAEIVNQARADHVAANTTKIPVEFLDLFFEIRYFWRPVPEGRRIDDLIE